MATQSLFTLKEYLRLLDLVYEVAQSLKGKPSEDPRWPACQQLASKIFYHSATIYMLRHKGTRAPVPRSPEGCWFYDFSAIAVLTRTVLETYLTLFEVFFEPTTEDAFEFNHALWQLEGFVVREECISSDPALRKKHQGLLDEIEQTRSRLKKTDRFRSLSSRERRKVLRGRSLHSWRETARRAGFSLKTLRLVYAYFSGHVHADGLCAVQIADAKTSQDQIDLIDASMGVVMMAMAKAVLDYAAEFPEAKGACKQNPDAYRLACMWSVMASALP